MIHQFSWRHVPGLLSGGAMFLGGLFHGLLRPKESLLGWGMTEEIARQRGAQIVYYGHTMRTSTLGLLIFIFYIQGDLTAIDTTMAIVGYCGIADVIVLWNYGNRNVVLVRLLSVLGVAGWGLMGLTAGRSLLQ